MVFFLIITLMAVRDMKKKRLLIYRGHFLCPTAHILYSIFRTFSNSRKVDLLH